MKKILEAAILVLSGTAIAALLLELSVRSIIGTPLNEVLPLVRVKADPDTGWVMLPNDGHYTYENFVRLNSLGFRGPEVSTKEEGEYRILAIGDSHVYGQGLADKELMTTVLEQELNRSSACTHTIINMGVRAYSTNNELALLRKTGLALDPDHVIVFFFINDFKQVDIAGRYKRFADYDWYTFDLSDKPTAQIIRQWKLLQLLRGSAAMMWIHDIYRGWTSKDNFENRLLSGQQDDEFRGMAGTTARLLDEFRNLSDSYDFRLTLAVIPVAAQIDRQFPGQLYQPTLKQYADETQLDYLDLLPAFRKYHEHNDRLPVIAFDGHFDADGHRVMAEAVLEHLQHSTGTCKQQP